MDYLKVTSWILASAALWAVPVQGTLSYGLIVDEEDIAFHTEPDTFEDDLYYISVHVLAGDVQIGFEPPTYISGSALPSVTADLDDYFQIEFTLSAPAGKYFQIDVPASTVEAFFEVSMWFGQGSITLLPNDNKHVWLDGVPYEDFQFFNSGVDPGGETWLFDGEIELVGGQQLTFQTLTLALDYSPLIMDTDGPITIDPRDDASISIFSLHPIAEGEPDSFLQVIPEPGTLGLLALAGVLLLGLRTRPRVRA